MSVIELLTDKVLDKDGKKVNFGEFEGSYLCLYFSAQWCGPCKAFTPLLVKYFEKYKTQNKFEIIFVSCDSDAKSADAYYKEMPWWRVDFDEDCKDKLLEQFDVEGIPRLVIINAKTGDVVCPNAKSKLLEDSDGKNFPYK